jgi:hypothetical protein
MIFKYELGVTLKSLIHGFEGVVMGRSEEITGCNVYMVQPRVLATDGKLPDAYWMSESVLVQTDAEKVILAEDLQAAPIPPKTFIFDLGVTVKSLVHGLEGVVTARAEFLGNTNRYRVQPVGVTKEGKLKHDYWIDEHALAQTEAKKVELAQAAGSGGPMPAVAGYR